MLVPKDLTSGFDSARGVFRNTAICVPPHKPHSIVVSAPSLPCSPPPIPFPVGPSQDRIPRTFASAPSFRTSPRIIGLDRTRDRSRWMRISLESTPPSEKAINFNCGGEQDIVIEHHLSSHCFHFLVQLLHLLGLLLLEAVESVVAALQLRR